MRTPLIFAAFSGLLAIGMAACADLKSASPSDGNDGGGGGTSGGTSGTSGSSARQSDLPSGPGAHGALPSGYCCDDDTECRDRHCVAVAGGAGKVCEDSCHEQGTCVRRNFTSFTCSSTNPDNDGWCQPTAAFTCIPQASYIRGTRAVGDCCTATGDGNSGEECEANRCVSTGLNGDDGPFYCTQGCVSPRDCPNGYVCGPFGTCDPGNFPYTCK